MTPEHLQILQHSLGADQWGNMPKRGGERNFYGTDDPAECSELVALGYMVELPSRSWIPETLYRVSDMGKKAMQEASPKPKKLTRSQKRYQDFLDASDAWGCSFREYLEIVKSDWYRKLHSGEKR